MIHVMIMAGGTGTRFWPMSRKKKPKQFLSIIDDDSLLESTLKRVEGISVDQNVWILGNASHSQLLQSFSGYVDSSQCLLEPCSRNTAACITWAAFEALKEDPDAICVVLSADAWIDSDLGFCQTLQQAIAAVSDQDALVTVGIPPTRAHTGYGYLAVQDAHDNQRDLFHVTSFKEKPSLEQAQTYVDHGYYWNAGIFVWRAKHILDCIQRHLPSHYKTIQTFTQQHLRDPNQIVPYYESLESISIDHAVLEHETKDMLLIPAQFNWDDIGNWSSLASYLPQDSSQNAANHEILAFNSHRNIVLGKHHKKVVLSHVDDLIVVDTDDALLILPKNKDQTIKDIYDSLEAELQ